MNTLQTLKGTGRTTRMVEYALERCKFGKTILIVCPDGGLAAHVADMAHNIGGGIRIRLREVRPASGGAIILYAMSDPHFDLLSLSIAGSDPDHEVLVEHGVIEHRLHKVLAMLHRFDN